MGAAITATHGGGPAIGAFSIIRSGSSTHTVNTDQRRIPLKFAAAGCGFAVRVRHWAHCYEVSSADSFCNDPMAKVRVPATLITAAARL